MKKVFVLSILLIFIMSVTVFAAQQNQNYTISQGETKNEIVFAGGQTITNNGTINNDLFAAGQVINSTGTVTGDIFTLGRSVSITGNVGGNIRLVGSDITVKNITERNASIAGNSIILDKDAVINGTVMAVGNMLTINGTINKGLYAAGSNVIIDGKINGDTRIDAANITITPNAKINGNLTYTSQANANIASGAVTGNVTKLLPPAKSTTQKTSKTFVSTIISKLIWIVGSFILGALLILLFKDFFNKTSDSIKSKWGRNLGIGALILIVTPIASLILLITIIGIPVSITALFAFFVLIYLAKIPVSIFLGDIILREKANAYVKLLLGLVIFGLIFLIPMLGGLVHFAIVLIGVGALAYNLVAKNKDTISE